MTQRMSQPGDENNLALPLNRNETDCTYVWYLSLNFRIETCQTMWLKEMFKQFNIWKLHRQWLDPKGNLEQF